jgi:hypothetical protein
VCVLFANLFQMPGEVRLDRGRENRHPVPVALGATDDDLIRSAVDVLNA